MSEITLKNLTPEQTLAIGEALMKSGEYSLAVQVYSRAVREGSNAMKVRAYVRRGLAARAGKRTQRLHALLDPLEALDKHVFISEGLATWQKRMPFMEDARFITLSERHEKLLPLANWQWNLQIALWAAQEALDVEGDFVELGVFRGHTSIFLAEYLDFGALPRAWRLYDTFEGIPDDQVLDSWRNANESAYHGTYSYEEVAERFASFANIQVIKGRVPEILDGEPDTPIAFLHIDMNNPSAEIAALDRLFDRVAVGGVILFDDYCWMPSAAQYDAEFAWFAARGLRIQPLPTGQGVFVKRRP